MTVSAVPGQDAMRLQSPSSQDTVRWIEICGPYIFVSLFLFFLVHNAFVIHSLYVCTSP